MFDEAINKGNIPVEMVHKRLETLNKIQQVNNTHMSEVAQKAKIKWVVEGDENTKFFHENHARIDICSPNVLSNDQRDDLECMVTKEEVKKAVWDCGSDKSPGPDARMDAMTIKRDAQYKELQTRAKQPTPDLDDDDMRMSREEEAKFMQTFRKTCFYNDYRDSNRDNWRSSRQNDYH
nr:RNA-directed DNA polymerase, eukaryota [Tanacetum cinerariifolium]